MGQKLLALLTLWGHLVHVLQSVHVHTHIYTHTLICSCFMVNVKLLIYWCQI